MVSLSSAQVRRPLAPLWKVVVNLVVNFAPGSWRQEAALANSGTSESQRPFKSCTFADNNFILLTMISLTMILHLNDLTMLIDMVLSVAKE